jgi:antitoxin (DNA-binding transcriptional repressor) of toxin-antitoxin stability system
VTTIDAALLHDETERVLTRVENGEELVVERNGRPVGRIIPIPEAAPRKVVLGGMPGWVTLKDGWDDPMTPEELAEWHVGPIFPEQPE